MRKRQLLCLTNLFLASLHCGEPAKQAGTEKGAERVANVAPQARQAASGPSMLAQLAQDAGPSGRPTTLAACQQDLARSRYLSCKDDGSLAYPVDRATGGSVLNFAAVGYHGGELPLPEVAAQQYVAPSGRDDTPYLQAAINAVGARAADTDGFRGRIVLAPGVFRINRTLLLAKSGVIIEGTASVGPNATTLKLTGSATTMFAVRGSGNATVSGAALAVATLPVPSGATQLTLKDASSLKEGDLVRVSSSRNATWIGKMWSSGDGAATTGWGDAMELQMPRTILAVAGNTITLDAPLPDKLPLAHEAGALGATVQKLDTSAYLREFGFAHMRLAGRFVPAAQGSPKLLTAIAMENAEDGYIDDIEATDFGASTVDLGAWTRHVTVQDVLMVRSDVQPGANKAIDINLRGQLNLVQGCASSGNQVFYVSTQNTDAAGPNVVQNYRAEGVGAFAPQQKWSTGLLLDNVFAPSGGIAFVNRGATNGGEGWAMGYGVAYNSVAGTHNQSRSAMDTEPGHTIDQPPTAANYGLGLKGPNRSANAKDPHYDSAGKPVAPASLWVHQLWLQNGSAALDQVMGPWHLRDAKSGLCLVADVARAGAYLVLRDCHAARQNGLWDATSRGSMRLGGTSLCMDADSDRRKTAVKLRPCVDDDEQHWRVNARGGSVTQVMLLSGDGEDDACLQQDGQLAVVGGCSDAAKSWQLISTHLVR